MLICRHCGTDFPRKPGRGRIPYYCSAGCRNKAASAKAKASGGRPKPARAECKQCGRSFEQTACHQMHCSATCRNRWAHLKAYAEGRKHAPRCAVSIKDCEVCAATYVARRSTSVACSEPCRRRFWTEYQRAQYQSDPEAHARRVREDRAAWSPERRAREREKARVWREQAGYFESKRAADQRRRARKLAAEVEKFTAAEIYERDRWRCGICSKKVRASLKHPHPMSGSLDHIVPLSLGGDHTRANARLAHLSCNVSRGNRMGTEQLALIG